MSTELATREEADENALITSDEAAAIIAASQESEYDDDLLSTPILKVGQPLTKEVQDGEAEPGEFINTLTNESLGDKVELIVSYYNKGRFAANDEGQAFVAFTSEIPEKWEPFVGKDFIGTPFAEHPESEEAFKAAVNNKEREWGHGPEISTTHNFTGYVIVEGENDEEVDYQPVRLSLKRTDVPAARKITTLQRAVLRNKPSWDVVLSLSTVKKDFGKNTAYVINPSDVKIVRKTTPEEKALGAELALAVQSGRTQSEGAESALADRPAEPTSAKGALEV